MEDEWDARLNKLQQGEVSKSEIAKLRKKFDSILKTLEKRTIDELYKELTESGLLTMTLGSFKVSIHRLKNEHGILRRKKSSLPPPLAPLVPEDGKEGENQNQPAQIEGDTTEPEKPRLTKAEQRSAKYKFIDDVLPETDI